MLDRGLLLHFVMFTPLLTNQWLKNRNIEHLIKTTAVDRLGKLITGRKKDYLWYKKKLRCTMEASGYSQTWKSVRIMHPKIIRDRSIPNKQQGAFWPCKQWGVSRHLIRDTSHCRKSCIWICSSAAAVLVLWLPMPTLRTMRTCEQPTPLSHLHLYGIIFWWHSKQLFQF